MKAIFALLFVAFATSAYSSQLPVKVLPEERILEPKLESFVKCTIGLLKNGITVGDIKIPALDPLVLKEELIPINSSDVSGTIKLVDVVFKGFSNVKFSVLEGSVEEKPLGLGIKYKAVSPEIKLDGTIEFDLVVKGKPIKRTIKLNASLKNLSFEGKLIIGADKKLAAFHVELALEKIDAKGEQDVVEIMKNLPVFLKANKKEISKAIDDLVMEKASSDIINKLLETCQK